MAWMPFSKAMTALLVLAVLSTTADERWQSGVQSDWEGELGLHDAKDVALSSHLFPFLPNAIQNMVAASAGQQINLSGMSFGNDVDIDMIVADTMPVPVTGDEMMPLALMISLHPILYEN
jgi:hypothetical protein